MAQKKIPEFAAELELTPARLYQLRRKGLLKTIDTGEQIYVTEEEQERFKALERKHGRPRTRGSL